VTSPETAGSEPSPATTRWLCRAIGSDARIVVSDAMAKASHTNHHIVLETSGGSSVEVLLRRFTNAERLKTDPWYEPVDEVKALRALERIDLSVPRLIAEDPEPVECDVPTLALTWMRGDLPGAPDDIGRFARRLAEPLPAVHGTLAPDVTRTYEPYFVSDDLTVADLQPPHWASRRSTWERLFEVVGGDPPEGPHRFIHRDYHQGNTVWSGDELTGIVDWTTGCIGPPGIDLAQMRINLAWEFDLKAADLFLDAWRAVATDAAYHPYWDLLDAADWLGDGEPDEDADAGNLERYEAFVAHVLAELG
jgi:aminoglycoside phosphotransferase (APT) family kinase protein